jgi:hypothetical protein
MRMMIVISAFAEVPDHAASFGPRSNSRTEKPAIVAALVDGADTLDAARCRADQQHPVVDVLDTDRDLDRQWQNPTQIDRHKCYSPQLTAEFIDQGLRIREHGLRDCFGLSHCRPILSAPPSWGALIGRPMSGGCRTVEFNHPRGSNGLPRGP